MIMMKLFDCQIDLELSPAKVIFFFVFLPFNNNVLIEKDK